LDVPTWLLSPLALVVGAALLGAVDTLVASVVGFGFLPAASAHELQRFSSSTHEFPPIRLASMFSAPVRCASTFAATVPLNGLRARYQNSAPGFSAVPHPCQSPETLYDFGKPEPHKCVTQSRTSRPASSMARCVHPLVRGSAHTNTCAPGFLARSHPLITDDSHPSQLSRPP